RLHLLLEIVERRRTDGERRAQLVRQLAGERLQILRVLAQPLEQVREAAREIPELIAGIASRQRDVDLAFRAERVLRGAREPPHAHRQERRIAEQAERDDDGGEQRERHQPQQRPIRQRKDRVAALLEQNRTDDLFAEARIPYRLAPRSVGPSEQAPLCERRLGLAVSSNDDRRRGDDRRALLGPAAIPRGGRASVERGAQPRIGESAERPLEPFVRRVVAAQQHAEQRTGEAVRRLGEGLDLVDRAGIGEDPAVRVDDPESPVGLAECLQDLVEIGLPTNERTGRAMLGIPRRIDRRDTRCAVDAIDVDEADAERLARDAERYAYLERESVGRLLPETLYAILVILGRREPRRARASRPKRPRRARAEHERLDDARVA